MKYVIREIEARDNLAVERVIRTCLIEFGANHEGTAWADPDLCRFSEIYNSEGNKYWVAEDERGEIVGGTGIGRLDGAEALCELQKMYCLPHARGTGVAHTLMQTALEYAKKHYNRCYLETLDNMIAAQKFYEKYDFERVYEPVVKTEHFACEVRYIKELRTMGTKKKIIFDTDIGGDCDDTGALAIIHQAQNSGLCELLCVSVSTSDPWGPACAEVINRYYGHNVPIGQTDIAPEGDVTMEMILGGYGYGKHTAETFGSDYLPGGSKKPENALRLLRKTLAENKGGKITLMVIGSCINFGRLLESKGDDISPKTGLELVGEQVELVSIMGGLFLDGNAQLSMPELPGEYNLRTDIRTAKIVFETCPVPMAISHFTVGDQIFSGTSIIENEPDSPVRESYIEHVKGKRNSWDPISAFYAVYGCRGGVFTDSRRGRVTVDDRGITAFFEGEGDKHHILIDCPDNAIAEDALNKAMVGKF